MKKLIIAASAVMVGFVVNAATISWAVADIHTFEGASATSTQLVMNEGVPASLNYSILLFTESDTLTRAGVLNDLESGSTAFAAAGIAPSDGFEMGEAGGAATGYDASTTYKAFYVVFNNETANDATYAFVSDLQDVTIAGAGAPGVFEDSAAASASGANWTAVAAAPEPTSGLLLLLGVAGLALRRRRA